MRKNLKLKIGALTTTFAMAGALAVVASGTTGAYFSDTQSGIITGTTGSIHVSTEGSTLVFTNLMPGEPQTVTLKYKNTGPVAQDVYLTFPNVPALHAFNNLGHFGEVHIADGGTPLFDSTNLSDDRPDATGTCGPFTSTGCWPLPTKLKVASNLGPTASGSVTFTFNYASGMGNGKNGGIGGVFNHYPSPKAIPTDATESGDGLPVNIVAVQVGQTP